MNVGGKGQELTWRRGWCTRSGVEFSAGLREPDKSAEARITSFEAAFQEHWQRVYQVIYRLIGNSAEAEDLAVEVFWRLHRQMSTSGKSLTPGWLYRVAVNLGLNSLRASRRRSRYEDAAAQWTTENRAAGDPLELAAQTEERDRVRSVLAQLKPRSARLLILRHSGLSYAELASALDIPLASVGSLLSRAEKEFERTYRERGRTERLAD
ncbi:MAG: sigma-70 family RNA polymerase sigma factor [Acidobacteria bacterium]|nr:MAG: sigma-70 family RNA polymerase sigma factor [Acidobacteriota bacterium]